MTDFRAKVYRVVQEIPAGTVATYGQVARAVGSPKAARAVGTALSKNDDPGTTPCHRVVRADGSIGGYAFGGAKKKREILRGEGVKFLGKRVSLTASQAKTFSGS